MSELSFSTQELGKRVAEIRGKNTQKELAKAIGVSRSYIGNIEQGITVPSLEVLINIAQQYHVSLDWLVYGNTNSSPVAGATGYQHKSPDFFLRRQATAVEQNFSSAAFPPKILKQFKNLTPNNQRLVFEFIKMLTMYEKNN
ncbi:transcriptional regulator, XRE family [Desulfofarcimen acetoxidans DSM 771]|jgi:transcriptional regulator with XRE-family HTH domain|uniref:Transcriptional regulator, XRE family n=1 Tax=Desulfofarcimen acetoxidans (strain ATCC 49208 / DSM 771 / KCTC 5769 / VKM B-1644 / 5575) TaxID=485916 RepID=C8W2W2_DESAS|nr:helix-turn-helix transcriptional regulator [Desulfofarcimen acetoxidans]ACV61118.1 transcriptional regulator, XRE family [Desulfofarcimen acetoxidans DSM 771]